MCFTIRITIIVRYLLRNNDGGKYLLRKGKNNMVLWRDKGETSIEGLNRERNGRAGKGGNMRRKHEK